jgi:putative NIF3 family GTP cyclohydrolase 1 type 2
MTLKQIYDLAIKIGIKNDFRTNKEIDDHLKRKKEEYDKLPKEEKEFFDKERLTNPYSDTRIHFDSGKPIKKALAGIDVTVGGLALAKEMGFDTVINHHPIGKALIGLDDVMETQIDLLEKHGIPVHIAEKITKIRISEVARGISPVNHYVLPDAAKLLKINLINIHSPADNCAQKIVDEKIRKSNPRYVGDILKTIDDIKEYKEAKKRGAGSMLFSGNEKNRCGKIFVGMAGGTEGSKDIFQAMSNAGVGTIVDMHLAEEHRKQAEKAHINVVIAGHISSDSVGMNVVLDEVEKGGIKITPWGGLIRKEGS